MPSMANITVKKSDGTTDVVFNAMAPSSGDGVAAVWRAEAAGSTPEVRPRFEMRTRYNGPRTARRADFLLNVPYSYTDTTTGLVKSAGSVLFSGTITLPVSLPDTLTADAVAYMGNLLDDALIQSATKSGFAPT